MTVQAAPPVTRRVESAHRLTFVRAIRGEWIKLSTLRSTWWSIGIAAACALPLVFGYRKASKRG